MKNTKERIIVGKFGSCYGVHGWLRIFSFTENLESIFSYQPWYIKPAGKWQLIKLKDYKSHNQSMIVKMVGIDDRDKANSLTDDEIYVDSGLLPQLTGGNFYWKDLIGCRVITTNGCDLGRVTDLMETGSNDVLVVKASLQDVFRVKERLLPFVDKQVIKYVDLDTKLIEVDWDPAL